MCSDPNNKIGAPKPRAPLLKKQLKSLSKDEQEPLPNLIWPLREGLTWINNFYEERFIL